MIALLALAALALSTLSPADPAIPPALLARLASTDVVILGELHDNSTHHRLQAAILRGLVAQGRRPALAMEQLDREHQAALDAALAAPGATPESVAEAGRFDRKGWDWPAYRPLLEIALTHQLPVVAANFSRADARTLVAAARAGKPSTPALGNPNIEEVLARADSPARRAAIEAEIERSHCGHRFEAPMLGGMVRAQQARDAVMAHLTAQAAQVTHAGTRRGAVLITGRGHARTDHGVPAYLQAQLGVFALGFLETRPGETPPEGPEPAAAGQPYDLVWRTAPAEREDPCVAFRAARPQAKPQWGKCGENSRKTRGKLWVRRRSSVLASTGHQAGGHEGPGDHVGEDDGEFGHGKFRSVFMNSVYLYSIRTRPARGCPHA